jgi:myo-inositol 2-dehydrogenase/D-chiro-inositol 1-dehydrogenase
MDDRLPLRSLEAGVGFPGGKPYADFMERFHRAYVDEMVAFTDLVAGRIETPCSVHEALQAFLVAEACDLSRHEGRPVHMDEVGR